MATMEWMQISFTNEIGKRLPAPLRSLFPYRLAAPLYTSDWQIAVLAHESFHAYQATVAQQSLDAALSCYRAERDYPWGNTAFVADWQKELGVLAEAVQVANPEEAKNLARAFLAQRDHRRQEQNLSASAVEYERRVEWLEGLGKYIELGIWRDASLAPDYVPLPALAGDPQFQYYAGAGERWNSERDQIKREAASEGDMRFYYSGWAQALLLDQLMPDWKARILTQDAVLEDLVREAAR